PLLSPTLSSLGREEREKSELHPRFRLLLQWRCRKAGTGAPERLFLLRRFHFDLEVAELARGNGGGRIRHQTGAFGCFGKGDDIADARRAAENRTKTIET